MGRFPPARLPTHAVADGLTAATGLVVFAGLAADVCRVHAGLEHGPLNVVPLLDLHGEATLPAWYSSILLFIAALLLTPIAWIKTVRRERFRRHWVVLAGLFLLLSMDEAISVHERIAWPIRRILEPDGPFYYGWVIPGLILVLGLGVAYAQFLLHLPASTRRRVVLAGALFVSGALLLEMIGGAYEARHGNETGAYRALSACEEILEMVGATVFVHALVEHIRVEWGGITLVLSDTPATERADARAATPKVRPARPAPGADAMPASS